MDLNERTIELYNQKIPIRKMAKILNSEGYKNSRGGPINSSGVNSFLYRHKKKANDPKITKEVTIREIVPRAVDKQGILMKLDLIQLCIDDIRRGL
jgi:hypothetical protein